MTQGRHTARLVLAGHIIDSMMLPSVMDLVMDEGGNFTIAELKVGQHKTDTSLCRMEIIATTPEQLDRIVRRARALGATAESEEPAQLEKVDAEGVFPEGFYSTSNLPPRFCSATVGYRSSRSRWIPRSLPTAVPSARGAFPFRTRSPGWRS